MFPYLNIGIALYGFHQPTLYLRARVIGVMKNAKLRMTTLTVQVEGAIGLAIELHSPIGELTNLGRCHPDNLLHGLPVADEITGNHGVLNVFIEVVEFQIGHGGNATLGERSVGFLKRCLANDANLALAGPCHLEDRKSTRLNSSHANISYAVFCL